MEKHVKFYKHNLYNADKLGLKDNGNVKCLSGDITRVDCILVCNEEWKRFKLFVVVVVELHRDAACKIVSISPLLYEQLFLPTFWQIKYEHKL